MKKNPILGSGKYTLMIVQDSETKMKGLGIVDAERFETFGNVGDRPNLEHIESLDEEIDTVVHFENLKGLEALISELEMQLEIINHKKVKPFKGSRDEERRSI